MNIEKTISEHAVSDILTPMLESQDRIVTEDVAPLFDQATGLDTPPASGTVTTTIEESRSVITAIIRKAWTATLTMLGGASVIGYITAAYTYLRNRLQGNETYGIPDRRSEISASSPLAANLALLNDRKIGGVPDAVDGMSILQLLCTANSYTELRDDNSWIMTKEIPWSLFPSVNKLHLGCKECYVPIVNRDLTEFSADHLEYFENNSNIKVIAGITSQSKLRFPVLKKLRLCNVYADQASGGFIWGCSGVEEVDMPVFEEVTTSLTHVTILCNNSNLRVWNAPNFRKINNCEYLVYDCPALWYVRLGTLQSDFNAAYGSYENNFVNSTSNLRHLELCADGGKLAISLHLNWWKPSAETIAHQDFLPNFRDYIAKRLKGGYPIGQGPILTLSQAVHNAITAAEDDYHIREIITQKGWTISPAPN